MSKTAIQQAIEFIKENCIFEISEDEETVIQINNDLLKQKLTELKEVEKQNIIDFARGIEDGRRLSHKEMEDYYNETFKD